MKNLDLIIQNYKEQSTEKLISIAKNPEQLNEGVIPYLRDELIKRGERTAADSLVDFMNHGIIYNGINYSDYTRKEIAELIEERLSSGESFESIKLDLKESGINIFDILRQEANEENQQVKFVENLRSSGISESEILDRLSYTFGTTHNEAENIKKRHANWKKAAVIIAILSFIFEVLQLFF